MSRPREWQAIADAKRLAAEAELRADGPAPEPASEPEPDDEALRLAALEEKFKGLIEPAKESKQ